jgi:hypothetical protein
VFARETVKATLAKRLEAGFNYFIENIVKSPFSNTSRLFDLGVGPAYGFKG